MEQQGLELHVDVSSLDAASLEAVLAALREFILSHENAQ